MPTVTATAPDGLAASVDPSELAQRLESDSPPLLVDVRTAAEFDTVRIPGSHNVPLSMLQKNCAELAEQFDGDVVLICQSGNRATAAKDHLHRAGLETARVLDGGVAAMEAQHRTHIRRNNQRWAMDRQVRMVAGSLVLTGFLGSRLISPKLGYLAAAVGTGLTVSALTNSCAMAAALQKMPWNQVAADPSLEKLLHELPTSIQVKTSSS